jgi:hypothetical protein
MRDRSHCGCKDSRSSGKVMAIPVRQIPVRNNKIPVRSISNRGDHAGCHGYNVAGGALSACTLE